MHAETQPSIVIDHILIGVPDLDRTVDDLAKALGVRPVYGGKHPRGTHNALLSLGGHTYLEFIALQPGVAGADIGMDDLVGLSKPVPIGWAVAAPSTPALRGALARSDFSTERTGRRQSHHAIRRDPAMADARTHGRACRGAVLHRLVAGNPSPIEHLTRGLPAGWSSDRLSGFAATPGPLLDLDPSGRSARRSQASLLPCTRLPDWDDHFPV